MNSELKSLLKHSHQKKYNLHYQFKPFHNVLVFVELSSDKERGINIDLPDVQKV